MNTKLSYSSMPMSMKRERLMAMRLKKKEEPSIFKNQDKKDGENANRSTKGAKVNARTYKKKFQMIGQRMKVSKERDCIAATDAPNEVDKTLVEKSCLGCNSKKRRVVFDSEGVCFKMLVSDATASPYTKPRSKRNRKVRARVNLRKLSGIPGGFGGWKSSENSPSASKNVSNIEHQNEGCTQIMREMLDENGGCSAPSQFGPRQRMIPTQDQPSDSIALNSSTNGVCESPNNQPPVSPLETELERIKNDREQATKLHQEKKLMLQSECEKEILEIRKKYDALIGESEMSLSKKLEVLERCYKGVHANKLLAELLRSWNCYDNTLDAAPERTQKETSSLKIQQIPASALVQPTNPSRFSPQDLGRTVLRAPAPHLRSSPSLFAPYCNIRTTCEPSSLCYG